MAFTPKITNTLALPCIARERVRVRGEGDVATARRAAADRGVPLLPLGSGSNVVLPEHLDAVVLQAADDSIGVLKDTQEAIEIRVGAGHDWHALVERTLEEGWFGFENLALIPGTVGAAPVQNIGAYGRELEHFVTAVNGFDLMTGTFESLSKEECAFTYRNSVFKQALRDRFFITSVDFRLSRRAQIDTSYPRLQAALDDGHFPATPQGVFNAVVAIRRERLPDPAVHPNVGSFFENPVVSVDLAQRVKAGSADVPVYPLTPQRAKLSAAWLIEASGLRGFQRGSAGMSSRHALVLENLGGATQADVLALAAYVRNTVSERFGVTLQVEPRLYGKTGNEAALP